MKKTFRVSSVQFDEDENVASVTAVASTGALGTVRELISVPDWTVLSESESQFTMPVNDALALFSEAGSIPGTDPRAEHIMHICDSLSMVAYGIMGE